MQQQDLQALRRLRTRFCPARPEAHPGAWARADARAVLTRVCCRERVRVWKHARASDLHVDGTAQRHPKCIRQEHPASKPAEAVILRRHIQHPAGDRHVKGRAPARESKGGQVKSADMARHKRAIAAAAAAPVAARTEGEVECEIAAAHARRPRPQPQRRCGDAHHGVETDQRPVPRAPSRSSSPPPPRRRNRAVGGDGSVMLTAMKDRLLLLTASCTS